MKKYALLFFGALLFVGCAQSDSETDGTTMDVSTVPEGQAIKVVEFFDFGCGHCRRAAEIMGKLEQDFGEELHVELKHFPLSVKTTRVAEASECARDQGAFKDFYQQYFEGYFGRTEDEVLYELAGELDLDEEAFKTCLNSGVMKTALSKDQKLAGTYGVRGTPFFVINEEIKIPGMPQESQLRTLFNQLLGRESQSNE